MAEFCLDCLNKISNTKYKEKDFIISDVLDFCEECQELKHIVVTSKKSYYNLRFTKSIFNFFKK